MVHARVRIPVVRWLAVISATLSTLADAPAALGQMACSYEIVAVIQAPDGPISESPTFVTAISPNGQHIVGWYRFDSVGPDKPWYWSQASGFVTLPMPPGFSDTMPSDINNSRVLVGTGWQNGYQRGFVYDMNTGQFTVIPPLTGLWSSASAINEAGTVTGYRALVLNGNPVAPVSYTWNAGTFVDLGLVDGLANSGRDVNDITDASISTGQAFAGAFARIWTSEQLINVGAVPGGLSSDAGPLNTSGQMVTGGIVQESPTVFSPLFVYDRSAGFTPLISLRDATSSGVGQIANNGLVVGHANLPGPGPSSIQRACSWPSLNAVDLNTLLVNPSGVVLRRSMGISESGLIVTRALNARADMVAVLLEPSPTESGDTNCDTTVDVDDLIAIITSWGPCMACPADLDSDGVVNVNDLLEVIIHWSQ